LGTRLGLAPTLAGPVRVKVTQIGHDTPGRAHHQRKIAEGKSHKEALRALKRRISDAVWRQLQFDLGRR
jgi:hypothetical protein